MKKPSLTVNASLSIIKTVMGIMFPLITFPYVSRILGVEGIGQYNFSRTVISYFSLLAALGIEQYAIREGARIREEDRFPEFASQMFSINLFSTVVVLLLLFLCILLVPPLASYRLLLMIFAGEIIFKLIAVEWIYSIYEDYVYIALRGIAVQFLSLILLFVFVKSADDVYAYALITVFSTGGAAIVNFILAKKRVSFTVTRHVNIKKHLKPILYLFTMSLAIAIYVSLDTTMLGLMCDDYSVGIYSVSVKIYTLLRSVLSAIVVVAIPRLSYLLKDKDSLEFSITANKIYNTVLFIAIPAVIGIILLRQDIVMLIAGTEFLESTVSLALLSVAVLMSIGSWFWANAILIPLKQEKFVFRATLISACLNVLLNFYFIPKYKATGAAITSIISEGFIFAYSRFKGRDYVLVKNEKHLLKIVAGCVVISMICVFCNAFDINPIFRIPVCVLLSVFSYFITEILLKNDTAFFFWGKVLAIWRKIKK